MPLFIHNHHQLSNTNMSGSTAQASAAFSLALGDGPLTAVSNQDGAWKAKEQSAEAQYIRQKVSRISLSYVSFSADARSPRLHRSRSSSPLSAIRQARRATATSRAASAGRRISRTATRPPAESTELDSMLRQYTLYAEGWNATCSE